MLKASIFALRAMTTLLAVLYFAISKRWWEISMKYRFRMSNDTFMVDGTDFPNESRSVIVVKNRAQ